MYLHIFLFLKGHRYIHIPIHTSTSHFLFVCYTLIKFLYKWIQLYLILLKNLSIWKWVLLIPLSEYTPQLWFDLSRHQFESHCHALIVSNCEMNFKWCLTCWLPFSRKIKEKIFSVQPFLIHSPESSHQTLSCGYTNPDIVLVSLTAWPLL